MLEQAQLREHVQALLVKEKQAQAAYAELAAKITDGPAKQQVEALRHDKERHIRLAERLLEILD